MYKLTQGETILRLDDGAFIAPDPTNRDYIEYQDWLSKGNTPQPADPVSTVVNISPLDFLNRFTQSEQLATLSSTDPSVRLSLLQLQITPTFTMPDARITAGVQAMVTAGILTQDRANVILLP